MTNSSPSAPLIPVRLVFVPQGGGEADYALDFDLPGVPRPGDYITVSRVPYEGTEDFIVRRSWWHLEFNERDPYRPPSKPPRGELKELIVEYEFALGVHSSASHKRACAGYGAEPFEDTAY